MRGFEEFVEVVQGENGTDFWQGMSLSDPFGGNLDFPRYDHEKISFFILTVYVMTLAKTPLFLFTLFMFKRVLSSRV